MELQSTFSAQQMTNLQSPKKLFMHDNIGFVELLECFGSDLTVVNAARVSMHKESLFEPVQEGGAVVGHKLSERDAQLIVYLAKHRHVTPFFHPQLRFRVKMPIYVVREWYRHTIGFARNEVSRRYVTEAPQCFVPAELRKRDKNIKQGSSKDLVDNNAARVQDIKDFTDRACAFYDQLLEQGVCPEQARGVLPQSMYTEFIETASLAAYARLAVLRLDPTAQKEIRDYAGYISTLVQELFPVSWKALMDTGKGMLL
jgi:thymidylate synthase (FAD)